MTESADRRGTDVNDDPVSVTHEQLSSVRSRAKYQSVEISVPRPTRRVECLDEEWLQQRMMLLCGSVTSRVRRCRRSRRQFRIMRSTT
jgi:BarA-like signal transduction histidine kinase